MTSEETGSMLEKLYKCGFKVEAEAESGREHFSASYDGSGFNISHTCDCFGDSPRMKSNYRVSSLNMSGLRWKFSYCLERAKTWASLLYAQGDKKEIRDFESSLGVIKEEPVLVEDTEVRIRATLGKCGCGGQPYMSCFVNDATYKVVCPWCGRETGRSPDRDSVEKSWREVRKMKK